MQKTLLSVSLLLAFALPSHAERYRYMDESGNIFWADSVREVPAKYRHQLLKPTPVRSGKEAEREYKEYLQKKKKAEQEKKKEQEERKKQEKEEKKRKEKEEKEKEARRSKEKK